MAGKDISTFFGAGRVKANANLKRKSETAEKTELKRPKLEPKPSLVKEEVVPQIASDEETAEEVLKRIPDADKSYLTIDPEMEGKNFFQLKAMQGKVSTVGHRDIPIGRPGCLTGLTIVFTGVLPSIDRNECERLAQQYGAKVTKSISGKTSCVVIGREAGPSKIKKILSLKTKPIDEDGFIQLISSMPVGGGSGESAQKARAKQEELENQILQEAKLEEDQLRSSQMEESKRPVQRSGSSLGTVTSSQTVHDRDDQLWTVRYAPTDMKHICGNKGNVETLYNWLSTWFETKHELTGGSIDNFKAVLISGPPGIGKTTAATLIAKKLGYDIIEKNASDFRSKKLLNDHLKVALDNTSVAGFFDSSKEDQANKKKICLIMDEVDGMSSGDNGGMAQIAQFCRITKTPMILICNDKSLPKMRTLDKCCFDMAWRRPTSREMKSRLMTIAHREGLKLDPNLIDQLVSITHNDIRQIINIMSTVSRTQSSLNFQNLNSVQDSWEKEVSLKPFDIVPRLLSANRLSINEKIGLYFNDMDLIPLMIHENYKMTKPSGSSNLDHLEKLSRASDEISESDLINSAIRGSDQQWSLLPFHAVMSTVYPAMEISGQVTGRINFTSWLGQNSKRMKFDRIVQNLQYHTCTKTHTNSEELRQVYIPYLRDMLLNVLIKNGNDGIDSVLSTLDSYYLTKEDFDSMIELGISGTRKSDDRFKTLPTGVKSALTRKYNSYAHPTIIYKTGDSVSKRGNSKARTGDNSNGDTIDDDVGKNLSDTEEVEPEDITKDSLIKAKVTKPKKKQKK